MDRYSYLNIQGFRFRYGIGLLKKRRGICILRARLRIIQRRLVPIRLVAP